MFEPNRETFNRIAGLFDAAAQLMGSAGTRLTGLLTDGSADPAAAGRGQSKLVVPARCARVSWSKMGLMRQIRARMETCKRPLR